MPRKAPVRKVVNSLCVIPSRHRKFAVPGLVGPSDVAVDLHVVGRIREHHPGQIAVHQLRNDLPIQRITAGEPVQPQLPEVTRIDPARRDLRHQVILWVPRVLRAQALDQSGDLGHLEDDYPDVEADVLHCKESLQLLRQRLLIPGNLLAPFLTTQPELRAATALRSKADISLEAAMRCLVDRHEEPIAAVWTKDGTIRYAVRGKTFLWIQRSAGELVSPLSRTATAISTRRECTTTMQEVAPATWTLADIPELYEQVRIGKDGHTLTLLWATLPDASDEEADEG